jgi:hypothetical protein
MYVSVSILLGAQQLLKTFKSRRKHQVDLNIPNRGNPSVTIKGPAGDRADIHFEWFEREKATKVAEMIAEGFSAKETSATDKPRHHS